MSRSPGKDRPARAGIQLCSYRKATGARDGRVISCQSERSATWGRPGAEGAPPGLGGRPADRRIRHRAALDDPVHLDRADSVSPARAGVARTSVPPGADAGRWFSPPSRCRATVPQRNRASSHAEGIPRPTPPRRPNLAETIAWPYLGPTAKSRHEIRTGIRRAASRARRVGGWSGFAAARGLGRPEERFRKKPLWLLRKCCEGCTLRRTGGHSGSRKWTSTPT